MKKRVILVGWFGLMVMGLLGAKEVNAGCSLEPTSEVLPQEAVYVAVKGLEGPPTVDCLTHDCKPNDPRAECCGQYYYVVYTEDKLVIRNSRDTEFIRVCCGGSDKWNFSFEAPISLGNYTLEIWIDGGKSFALFDKLVCGPEPFEVTKTPTPGGPGPLVSHDPCADKEGKEIPACKSCLGELLDSTRAYSSSNPRENETTKSWTALGCIPNDPEEFVAWILARAVGIGGGIAFLLMLWGGFQVITSAGDPQKLNNGKDILVSAAVGLLFIIFSIFLLKIVGVDILGLPGFNP